MTNNEIIRDLFRCANKDVSFCKECQHRNYSDGCCIQLMKDALDLIIQQKTEIKDERAKGEMCAEVIKRQDKEIARLTEQSEDAIKSKELNDLLYVIRTNMTSITRYVRHKRNEHPTLTDGQFLDRNLEYKKLAESAVSNILKYINGTD